MNRKISNQSGPVFAVFLSLCLFHCVLAEIAPVADKPTEDKVTNLSKNCNKSYSATCLKMDVVSFVDKLSRRTNIGILPGVSIVKEDNPNQISSSEMVANLARDFPNDVDKRLDAYLIQKVGNYLSNHAVSVKLFDPKSFSGDSNEGTSQERSIEGRKKDKGAGGMMAGLMMMKGTLGALGFGALAMLAGKALMTGLMALMLSAIVGLKSLTSHHSAKTTYEIVSKPVYTTAHTQSSEEVHGHGYGGSGYGRSLDDVHETVQQAVMKYGNALNRRSLF